MLTPTLVSLPLETARAMAEHTAQGGCGGSAQERSAGTVVLLVTVVLATASALLLH